MSVINYKTRGVCSREIIIDVEDNIIKDVKFIGGCHGNTQGISTLVKGMKVEEVINKLKVSTATVKELHVLIS